MELKKNYQAGIFFEIRIISGYHAIMGNRISEKLHLYINLTNGKQNMYTFCMKKCRAVLAQKIDTQV